MSWVIDEVTYADPLVPVVGYTPPAFGPHSSGIGVNITPVASNTGVEPWGQPLALHSGDITVTVAGTTVGPYWKITGRVIIKAANVTVDRCLIVGSGAGPAGAAGLIDARNQAAVNFLVTDCTFKPATPSLNWNAWFASVSGTFRRCKWLDTVDGGGIYNNNTGHTTDAIKVLVEGCYGDLASFFSPDASHPDNQTHNDTGAEIQGSGPGSLIEFRYSNVQAFADLTIASEDGSDARPNAINAKGDIGRSSTNQNSLGGYSQLYPTKAVNSAFQTTHLVGSNLHGLNIHHNLMDGGTATFGMALHSGGVNGFDNFIYNNVFGGNSESGQDFWADQCSAWNNFLPDRTTAINLTTPSGRVFLPWSTSATESMGSNPSTNVSIFNGADPAGGTWATGHCTYDSTNHRMDLLASTSGGVTTLGGFYWQRTGSAQLGGAWEIDFTTDNVPGYGLVIALVPETGTVPKDGQINLYELKTDGTYGTVTSGGISRINQATTTAPTVNRYLTFPSSSTRPQAADTAAGNYRINASTSTTLRVEWQPAQYLAVFVNGELRSFTTDTTFIPSTKAMNLSVWQECYGTTSSTSTPAQGYTPTAMPFGGVVATTTGAAVTSAHTYVTRLQAYTR